MSTLVDVPKHLPSFARIERDLVSCQVGTVLRYHGGRSVTVVVLETGFEVASEGEATQTWSWVSVESRVGAATQAAQYVSNRLNRSPVIAL